MARQELVKKSKARAISVAEGAINPMAPAGFLRFYYQGQEFEVAEADWAETLRGATPRRRRRSTKQVIEAGGLVHPGHGAARVAAHRQPAARARRPPGRSRRIALLSLA